MSKQYKLVVCYKMTRLDNIHSAVIQDGKLLYSELPQDSKNKYLDEIKAGKIRTLEMEMVSDCFESAKQEAIEVVQSVNGNIVLSVEVSNEI